MTNNLEVITMTDKKKHLTIVLTNDTGAITLTREDLLLLTDALSEILE